MERFVAEMRREGGKEGGKEGEADGKHGIIMTRDINFFGCL